MFAVAVKHNIYIAAKPWRYIKVYNNKYLIYFLLEL